MEGGQSLTDSELEKAAEELEAKAKEKAPSFLSCSFCGQHQSKVKKLIAGPNVYICDECIGLCVSILWEEDGIDQEVFDPFTKNVMDKKTNETAPWDMYVNLKTGGRMFLPRALKAKSKPSPEPSQPPHS